MYTHGRYKGGDSDSILGIRGCTGREEEVNAPGREGGGSEKDMTCAFLLHRLCVGSSLLYPSYIQISSQIHMDAVYCAHNRAEKQQLYHLSLHINTNNLHSNSRMYDHDMHSVPRFDTR